MLDAMNSPDFEKCPSCSERTASEYFRTVKDKRLCFLCAQRAEESDASFRAHIEDQRHHGLGWLWKSIACTAGVTIVALIVRYFIISYLRQNLGH